MKKTPPLTEQDKQLFKDAIGKIKPLIQDKLPRQKLARPLINRLADNITKQRAEFYFSDEFEPDLSSNGPIKYVRDGVSSYEAKNLRRGEYIPDLILDLHGLTQRQAKQEIAALLYASQKQHAKCVCIVHGIGSKVLKNKVPHWLVQHPDVMAFHQAPLQWGGDGALLVLLELKDKAFKR